MESVLTFNKRVAVVTGATKGIGKAIALKLAKAGVAVAIIGRDQDRAKEVVTIIQQAGGEAVPIIGDVADENQCEKMLQKVSKWHSRIDILVNCAGILTSTHIEDITRVEWDSIISTNLSGTFFMIQKVIPFMKQNGYGRIINIGSNAGRMGGYENSQAYTASKGGMIAITMGIARQMAEYGITVNIVCPGTTDTKMAALYDEETRDRLLSRIPIRRFVTPDEVAAAVCYFASEEAGCVTGAILDVNGGMYMG